MAAFQSWGGHGAPEKGLWVEAHEALPWPGDAESHGRLSHAGSEAVKPKYTPDAMSEGRMEAPAFCPPTNPQRDCSYLKFPLVDLNRK